MKFPSYITTDIEAVRTALAGHIKHCGLFGSVLQKEFDQARDIDVLFVYDETTFEDILSAISNLELTYVVAPSYLNYSSGMATPPDADKYYHFIFMPMRKPNRDFMVRHEGQIHYLTAPFTSWKRPNKSVDRYVPHRADAA